MIIAILSQKETNCLYFLTNWKINCADGVQINRKDVPLQRKNKNSDIDEQTDKA